MLQNLCDTHTHTLYSRHAYSTVRENVLEASAAGLELLGITEHFSDMLHPGATLTHANVRDFQYFDNFGVWPREWEGVRLLHGCEVDIRSLDGALYGDNIMVTEDIVARPLKEPVTLSHRVFSHCDYVVASVHYSDFARGCSVAQATQMYVNVLHRDKVLTLGHTGRSAVRYDLDEVVGEAARLHKLIEINEHSLDMDGDGETGHACAAIAEKCAELGCQVAVNTDAHICTAIGKVPRALEMLERIHFPQELIATRSAEAFLAAKRDALGE